MQEPIAVASIHVQKAQTQTEKAISGTNHPSTHSLSPSLISSPHAIPRVVAGACACVSTAAMANEAASVGSSTIGAAPSSMRDSAAPVSASESASEYADNEEDEDDWSSSSSGDEDDSEPDTGRAASVRGSMQRY